MIADETTQSGVLSSDGRYVAFSSQDTDITEDELSGDGAVFLKDLQGDTISSVADYAYFPSLSEDGRFVSYASCIGDSGNYPCHLFRFDSQTDTTLQVTEGAEDIETLDSGASTIASDGSVIVFRSNASNLVDDDTNEIADIFVWEEPVEEEVPENNEDSGRNGSSGGHRRSTEISNPGIEIDSLDEPRVMELQRKLIELLKQLILLLAGQQ